eukprot:6162691-Prymnesium_polylepis.1
MQHRCGYRRVGVQCRGPAGDDLVPPPHTEKDSSALFVKGGVVSLCLVQRFAVVSNGAQFVAMIEAPRLREGVAVLVASHRYPIGWP